MTTTQEIAEDTPPKLNRQDFISDQEVRWCPGCGDYAILSSVQHAFAKLGIPRHKIVIISGIGCAARFPYYVDCFGFHTIHGRAPALATGLKVSRPDLSVWVVGGDGDMLSIGGNHLLHALRRNVGIKILCINNRIYGLTKGQYSPTSEFGKKTKSTPAGSPDYPINPLTFAVGSGCTFIARSIDIDVKHLEEMMIRAAGHRGTSFIEIYQNCNIYNHQTWFYASQKGTKQDTTIKCEHGKPLIFGAEGTRGLRMNGTHLEVVELGNGLTEQDMLVHDETDQCLAFLLSQLHYPEFPEPLGVIYCDDTRIPYEDIVLGQVQDAIEAKGPGDLKALLNEGDTWLVEDD